MTRPNDPSSSRDLGARGGRNQERVLAALTRSGQPMTAYQLLDRLRPEGIGAPPSIYRALNQLVAAGRVHRLETLNAYIACGHAHGAGGPAFAICERCRRVMEIEDEALLAALGGWAGRSGFRVGRVAIEMVGRCADCPARAEEEAP